MSVKMETREAVHNEQVEATLEQESPEWGEPTN